MERILFYFLGYVVLTVKGTELEAFINTALDRGITMWNIRRLGPKRLTLNILLKDFWGIRALTRELGLSFHIVNKRGVPFIWRRLRRRKMVMIGAALFIVGMIYLSSFVWVVSVKTDKPLTKIEPEKIIETADKYGAGVGSLKWTIDAHELEDVLMEDFPELAWIGVEVKGTKVEIQVVEKVFPSDEQLDKRPGELIASKPAIVEEILVFNGEAKVERGDTVNTGQVLISGMVYPEFAAQEESDTGDEESGLLPRLVRAKGIVKGRVWYRVDKTVSLKQVNEKKTGKSFRRTSVKFPDREITIQGLGDIPFDNFQQERKTLFEWRSSGVAVEIVTTAYHEVEKNTRVITAKEAEKLVLQKTLQKIKKDAPRGFKLLNQQVEILERNSEKLKVRITIEMLEDIAEYRSF